MFKNDNSLHRRFVIWPLRLIVVSSLVLILSLWFLPFSKLFIGAGVVVGALHSLSTMEELTGGRELMWLSIPLVLAADVFLAYWSFGDITYVEREILVGQFLAVIVLTESVIVFLLSSRLRKFSLDRASDRVVSD